MQHHASSITSPPTDAPAVCAGAKRNGTPCEARVLVDGRFCFAHAPALDGVRAEARRRGGRNRAGAIRLRRLVPPRLISVYDHLETALDEVHTGALDPKVAGAMAALARAMVAVLTAGELEERLRRLEGRNES